MDQPPILLVEDNQDDVALTRRALAKNRIANPLIVAEDGQEAIDYLFSEGKYAERDESSLPVLILLDLKLPRVPGLEVLRRIRENERTRLIPVVILTSSKEEEDVASGYAGGANSYLRKSVDFTEFSQVIEQFGLYWLVLNIAPPRRP